MFVSSHRSSEIFCLFFYFLLVVNSSIGQLVDDISAKSNGQQNQKINSIKQNSLVSSDSVEQPAAGSDSLTLSKKFAFSNKNFETQSASKSGTLTPSAPKSTEYLTPTVASVVIGAKKCE